LETLAKRIKYRTIVPALITVANLFLSNRNRGTQLLSPTNPPFFIIGSGRNGSTLLASFLNAHPNIFLPPEQYALPYAIMKWHLFRWQSWDATCKLVLNDFEQHNRNWSLKKTDFFKIQKQLSKLEKHHRNLPNIVEAIYREYAILQKKHSSTFGDYSPLTTHFVPLIKEQFPNCKFIFLIRDPRDVILSYSKMKHIAAAKPAYAAWKWNDSIKTYDWLLKSCAHQVMLVRYEDFVKSAEQILKSVLSFLGADFDQNIMLRLGSDQQDPMRVRNAPHHHQLYRPINRDNVGNWQRHGDPEFFKKIEPLITKNRLRFEY
jgi:hypothetical protein